MIPTHIRALSSSCSETAPRRQRRGRFVTARRVALSRVLLAVALGAVLVGVRAAPVAAAQVSVTVSATSAPLQSSVRFTITVARTLASSKNDVQLVDLDGGPGAFACILPAVPCTAYVTSPLFAGTDHYVARVICAGCTPQRVVAQSAPVAVQWFAAGEPILRAVATPFGGLLLTASARAVRLGRPVRLTLTGPALRGSSAPIAEIVDADWEQLLAARTQRTLPCHAVGAATVCVASVSAPVLATHHYYARVVTLSPSRVLAQSAPVTVSWTPSGAPPTPRVLSPAERACAAYLSARPFTATDGHFFSHATFPLGITYPLASVQQRPTEQQSIAEMVGALINRARREQLPWGTAAQIRAMALALYHDPRLVRLVPNPTLRAALVMTKGTVGAGAIAELQSGVHFDTMAFGRIQPGAVGESFPGSRAIHLNPRLVNERAALLTSTIMHETLHQDLLDQFPEEFTNRALDSLVYMQQVLDVPGLAATRSGFTQILNEDLVARFNSGTGTDLRLYRSTGLLFPGNLAVSFKTFADYTKSFYREKVLAATPGNAVLASDLRAIAAPGNTVTAHPNFDQATLNFIDHNQPFSPCTLVRIAGILKLAPAGPHAPPAPALPGVPTVPALPPAPAPSPTPSAGHGVAAPSPTPTTGPAATPTAPAHGGGTQPGGSGWLATASAYHNQIGARFIFTCPPGGTAYAIWGTDTYTDDSSVCTAAVHRGLITVAHGGTVIIEMRRGLAAYVGSTRHGVTSHSYPAWLWSFVFPAAPPAHA